MAFPVQAEAPPLREEADGALRVGSSRVLLELVIRAFEDGTTPEAITQRYDSLSLPDVYGVIAYYLRHRQEVEAYIARRERAAQEIQKEITGRQKELTDIRARLLARRQQI